MVIQRCREEGQRRSILDHIMGESITQSPYDSVALIHSVTVLEIDIVSVEVIYQSAGPRKLGGCGRLVQMGAIIIKLQAHPGIMRNGVPPSTQDIAPTNSALSSRR